MPRSNSIRGFAHLLLLYRASIKHPLITTTNPSMATIPTKDRDPLAFTAEENDAMRATKLLLLTKLKLPEEKISSHILAVTTMNCKCQPAVAAEKYAKWLKLVDEGMGIKSFGEVLDEVGLKGEKLVGSPYEVGLANVYYGKFFKGNL